MVVAELAINTLPVVLGVILSVSLLYVVALCTCRKKKEKAITDAEVQGSNSKHNSAVLSESIIQTNINDVQGAHLDVETAVTPLNTSMHSQNGTLHSRGNSVDLTKTDRHSAASAGSSPRPNTISRELPDIPVIKSHTLSHSQLPDPPVNGRVSCNTLDSHHRGHTQLPDIPSNRRAATMSVIDSQKGGHSHPPELPLNHPTSLDSSRGSNHSSTSANSNNGARPKVASLGNSQIKDKSSTDNLDDYDHINETKRKARPRSDYDHVVIEGDSKHIIPAKKRMDEYNDYAEVKNENIYEGVPEDVTVISVSKPNVTSIRVGGASPRKTAPSTKLQKVDSINDPYNRIKGDDPPYNKIVDDPYNKIKVDDPYNKVKDDDPYNKVKDTDIDDLDPYDDPDTDRSVVAKRTEPSAKLYDPYSLVLDEERNVSNQTDPYARVVDTESEIDDPYNKVVEDGDSVSMSTNIPKTNDARKTAVVQDLDVEYAKVNKNLTRENPNSAMNQNISNDLSNIPSTSAATDEYATVQKVRKFSEEASNCDETQSAISDQPVHINSHPQARILPEPQTPPEPPRAYARDTDQESDHYNTLSASLDPTSDGNQPPLTEKKREPPYNKLSVRESLASMNARISNNPYEYVSEVDNLYATVDGSSGDGVVRRRSTKVEQRESTASEYYAEIEGAASAPAPPSLDSLHETAKHHLEERRKGDGRPGDIDYYKYEDSVVHQGVQGHPQTPQGQGHHRTPSGQEPAFMGHSRTPSGQGHIRTPSGQGHIQTPSGQGHIRTPSGGAVMTPAMTSSYEGPVVMATQNRESTHDYQDMTDDKMSDINSEFDPNYETVEEAKSKVKYEELEGENPKVRNHIYEEADSKRKYEVINGAKGDSNTKIRSHVYEEVTSTNEARRVRQRVLSQHTYEEVTDVKGQGQSGKGKQNGEKDGANGVQKRSKGHERTSSGDGSWFGKRRSGELKDKQKESKKKSDTKDKEKENRKSGERSSRL